MPYRDKQIITHKDVEKLLEELKEKGLDKDPLVRSLFFFGF